MEREVGGGIGMGNTYKPMAVSFQCMTKSTAIKKNIKKYKSGVRPPIEFWWGTCTFSRGATGKSDLPLCC